MKHLNYLDLSYNNFNGTQIPRFLISMGSLRFLNLFDAGYGGVILYHLGNLSNLHYLNLEGNDSSVNNLQWLSGLPLLQHLDMSYVNLSIAFDWLHDINKLSSLLELQLSDCAPPYIPLTPSVNFSSLTTLDLSSNHFENTLIPSWIFGLCNMLSLDLSDNDFHGLIPVDLQNMTFLTHLDLSSNYFNSSIPYWLYIFIHLESLNLGSNKLQGSIFNVVGNLTSIISIDLLYNELGGKLRRSLGNLCNLREIILSSNHWSQEISKILKSLSGCLSYSLEFLKLSHVQISSHLNNELGQFKNLLILSFWNNSISDPILESIRNLTSLRFLNLSYNRFNRTFPQNFGQLSKLTNLFIESNMLNGVVFEVHFSSLTRLKIFYALKTN